MMQTSPLNQVLQQIAALSMEDQSMVVQMVMKRLHESKRSQLLERIHEAEDNYQAGRVTTGTVAQLMRQVQDD